MRFLARVVWFVALPLAPSLLGCDLNSSALGAADGAAIDHPTPTLPDAQPLEGSVTDAAAPDASNGSGVGVTEGTTYAGAPGTVSANPSATDGGPASIAWTLVSAPTGSGVTSASIAGASTPVATLTPDVVGDYVLQVIATRGATHDTATTTLHALAAPVFYARTVLNASGGVLDVHVSGHDGSQSHGLACPSTFDTSQAENARLRTMLTGAGAMDMWEAPAGQASRFAFAGVVALTPDDAGNYAVSLIAGTTASSCTSAPQTLKALAGPVGALGQPRFSPDGKRVAFLEPQGPGQGTSFRVATVAFDGTGYRAVAPIYAAGAAPDGSADESSNIRVEWKDAATLTWARPEGGGAWSVVTASDAAAATPVVAMTCSGSTPHHVIPLADGSIVASYSPAIGAPTDLFVLTAGTNKVCQVAHNLSALAGPNSRAHDASLSPDGKAIAFLRYDAAAHADAAPANNEGDLYVAPTDGSSPAHAIAASTTGRIGPRWIGSGTRLTWTRAAQPGDGGDPKYANAVSVVLLDGGGESDLAAGDGVGSIVAGVGPGGSCAIGRGAGGPAATLALLALVALIFERRRASKQTRSVSRRRR